VENIDIVVTKTDENKIKMSTSPEVYDLGTDNSELYPSNQLPVIELNYSRESDLSSYINVSAKICIVLACILMIFIAAVAVYGTLLQSTLSKGGIVLGLAPIGMYWHPTILLPAKIAYIFTLTYVNSGWILAPVVIFLISICLKHEFKTVSRQFKEVIRQREPRAGERGRLFIGRIECFRMRHHKIARLVEKADKCLGMC